MNPLPQPPSSRKVGRSRFAHLETGPSSSESEAKFESILFAALLEREQV
jgi:hypothetical protein